MNASDIKLSITEPQVNLGDGYLQLKLNASTIAVLLVKFTQEVFVLPYELITPIPNISKLILGLINWHNRVIWVVDLPNILGLESQTSQLRQYNIIVIRHQTETIGLMVPEVKGTIRFNSDNIQSASEQVSPDIIPYLEGCIWRENEFNLVLNIQAILKLF
ncbi:chemotaxis protein CheW [Plectonema cf. radiosum LEGE 06105]|uniref:Chemotaxis protein CheW n=1 Tax=Plectonema cf. radiosum LEGE 06105 TaxID=945769 RepID=A0A8J7JZJ2_9CYAN|nr:chemotaxis protein CheW [Plectonema radiosum]MBE9212122.1 chemotaxis protein CheW [Plectonema cf. radiosum LEGE 06105]